MSIIRIECWNSCAADAQGAAEGQVRAAARHNQGQSFPKPQESFPKNAISFPKKPSVQWVSPIPQVINNFHQKPKCAPSFPKTPSARWVSPRSQESFPIYKGKVSLSPQESFPKNVTSFLKNTSARQFSPGPQVLDKFPQDQGLTISINHSWSSFGQSL